MQHALWRVLGREWGCRHGGLALAGRIFARPAGGAVGMVPAVAVAALAHGEPSLDHVAGAAAVRGGRPGAHATGSGSRTGAGLGPPTAKAAVIASTSTRSSTGTTCRRQALSR